MVKPVDASQPMAAPEEAIESARHRGQGPVNRAVGFARGSAANGRSLHDGPNTCRPDARARARKVDLIVRTLERDVIPRLVRAHRAVVAPAAIDRAPGASPTPDDVKALVALASRGDPADVGAYVQGLQARGVPLERIYLELLAPVAQRLGTMWESDATDFATVTMALTTLQQVVMETGRLSMRGTRRDSIHRRVALSPSPGEQHTFGLLIVAEFFRRSGWDVWSGTGESDGGIADRVHAERYAMAGFTLAGEDRLVLLAAVIRKVRQSSLNPGIGILVGGPLFVAHPELVLEVGADATAADGPQAVLQAETWLALDAARA